MTFDFPEVNQGAIIARSRAASGHGGLSSTDERLAGDQSNGSIVSRQQQREPRVVVGMPVYNSAKWLSNSLAAWTRQTRRDFRIIISDNASTDGSYEICADFANRDPRIELHRNPRNIGICGNFRRVFELGRDSDYFMWASSHDYFAPTMLARCVAELESRPDAVICCGRTALFDTDPKDAEPYEEVKGLDDDSPYERFRAISQGLRVNNLVHGLIRTEVLASTPLVDDYYSSDNVLIAQLALTGKILQLPEVLFYRRWDPDASTSRMSEQERRRHWDPDNRGMTRYTHWKINRGYIRAVLRTDVERRERRRALTLALKGLYWDRHRLARDLGDGVRELWARRHPKEG